MDQATRSNWTRQEPVATANDGRAAGFSCWSTVTCHILFGKGVSACWPATASLLEAANWSVDSGRKSPEDSVHHVSPRWLEPRMENIDTAPEMNDLR